MIDSLQNVLGDFYKNHVLSGKPVAEAAKPIKELFSTDNHARDSAVARLAELNEMHSRTNGNLHKRCYVSHVQRLVLMEALNV